MPREPMRGLDRRLGSAGIVAACLIAITVPGFAQTSGGEAATNVAAGETQRPAGVLVQSETDLAVTLDGLRRSGLDIAVDVIALQRDINGIEERIDALRGEESAALEILDDQRDRLNRLAAGLQRLSRTPLEVWAIADGPSAELIRGSLLLNDAMEPVEQEAQTISQTIAALSDARARLAGERTERDAIAMTREERMSELNRIVGDRQTTLEQLIEDSGAFTERLSRLAVLAGSLTDLMSALESDRQLQALDTRIASQRTAISQASIDASGTTIEDYAEELGADRILLPAAGVIETEFGTLGPSGEPAQRVAMAVDPATLVVAPLAGIVRYSGPFQDDGLILILDHGGGYHSIIANVGRLDARAGQAVASGEPVAVTALPQSETTPTSTLFFEVRRNGSPVNPMTELVLAQGRGPE